MPKIPRRCWWYDEQGNPTKGKGCLNANCNFAHPSDPEWQTAPPPKPKERNDNKGWGSNDRDRRDSWDAPPRSTGSAGSDWNFSGVEKRTSTVTSTNTTPLADTGRGWGLSNPSKDQPSGSRKGSGDWGNSSGSWNIGGSNKDSGGEASSSWGAGDSSKASETASNGWGSEGGWGNHSANGWGKGGWENAGGESNTGGGWGSAPENSGWNVGADKGDNGGKTTAKAGGWGSSAGEGGNGSSWGGVEKSSKEKTSGWGATPAAGSDGGSSWGGADKSSNGKTSGWGSTATAESDGGSGWGGGGASSGWNTGPDDSKRDKGKERATDMQMHDPSPLSSRTPMGLTTTTSDRLKRPDLPRIKPNAPPRLSGSPAPSSVTVRPTAGPSKHDPSVSFSLKQEASQLTTPKMPLPDAASKLKFRGPKGRVELYQAIVGHMQKASMLQTQVQKVIHNRDRWKRTQTSAIYSRSTQETRRMLDTERLVLSQRETDLKHELHAELNALMTLPDFANNRPAPSPLLTKELIVGYTQELKDWFKDLQLNKRLLLDIARKEESVPPEVIADILSKVNDSELEQDIDETPPRPTPSELLAQGQWTWKELKQAAAFVEEQLSVASEEIYSNMFTHQIEEMDQHITELKTHKATEIQEVLQDTPHEDIPDVSRSLDIVGDQLATEAQRLSELLEKADNLQRELAVLEQEKTSMDEMVAQAERSLEEMERWEKADKAIVDDLTEQMRTLHLHKRGSTSPSSSTKPLVNVDDLQEYIRPIVIQTMQQDLAPIFFAMRARCSENQNELVAELDKHTMALIEQTNGIRSRVLAIYS